MLLSYDEAAAFLKIPRVRVYYLVNKGVLPRKMKGERTAGFDRSELETFMNSDKAEWVIRYRSEDGKAILPPPKRERRKGRRSELN